MFSRHNEETTFLFLVLRAVTLDKPEENGSALSRCYSLSPHRLPPVVLESVTSREEFSSLSSPGMNLQNIIRKKSLPSSLGAGSPDDPLDQNFWDAPTSAFPERPREPGRGAPQQKDLTNSPEDSSTVLVNDLAAVHQAECSCWQRKETFLRGGECTGCTGRAGKRRQMEIRVVSIDSMHVDEKRGTTSGNRNL